VGKAEAIRAGIARAGDGILSVLVAPTCAACRAVLDTPRLGPVCARCWTSVLPLVPPLCERCGDPLPSWRVVTAAEGVCARCRRMPSLIRRGRSAGEYEGSLREIIHALKYEGRQSLARPLARLMLDAGGDLLEDADYLVPVPLHPWRRLRRGFNQAAVLAGHLGLPVVHALWRRRSTPPQSGLSAGARRRNVKEAFRLAPFARSLDGRHVVLIDDVRTTGATLEACASVLLDAGVQEVGALTVATRSTRRIRSGPGNH
jgi:ComF family protein